MPILYSVWRIDRRMIHRSREISLEREENSFVMHVRVYKSRFSSVQTIIVKRIIERSTWVLGKVSPRFKITDFNRALSPLLSYIAALSPRKHMAERSSVRLLSGRRILCELSYHCIKLYCTVANLCCFFIRAWIVHISFTNYRKIQSERWGQTSH